MYPFIRLAYGVLKQRKQPPIGLTETMETTHICWPWDIDIWMELNNGRSLSIYDLARIPLAMRTPLWKALRDKGWLMTMAGVTVRWRRRVRMFDKFTIRSRGVCWDDKFIYIEQSMWKTDGECASHVLYRTAVTDRNGLVRPDEVCEAMNIPTESPPIPDWVAAWISAEAVRPWPPMQE